MLATLIKNNLRNYPDSFITNFKFYIKQNSQEEMVIPSPFYSMIEKIKITSQIKIIKNPFLFEMDFLLFSA